MESAGQLDQLPLATTRWIGGGRSQVALRLSRQTLSLVKSHLVTARQSSQGANAGNQSDLLIL